MKVEYSFIWLTPRFAVDIRDIVRFSIGRIGDAYEVSIGLRGIAEYFSANEKMFDTEEDARGYVLTVVRQMRGDIFPISGVKTPATFNRPTP